MHDPVGNAAAALWTRHRRAVDSTGPSDARPGTPVDNAVRPVDDHDGADLGRRYVIHNPQALLPSLSEFEFLVEKGPCVKFRCERDTLVEALATAGRAVTPRASTTPALNGVRIEVAGNRLTVVGTDLDLTVRVEVEAIGLDDGSLVAPARLVADIVRSLEPGAVTFEGGDDEVEISAARSRFVVRTYPVEDFPVLADPRPDQVTLPAAGAGRSAAPGGAGRVQRRRPAAADRGAGGGRGGRDPAGGDRLLPAGHARPGRRRAPGRGGRADPGPGARPDRTAAAACPAARVARRTAPRPWGSR